MSGVLTSCLAYFDLAFVSERKQLGALLATVNKSKLNISYEILEKATNYFHNSNKLGQGGSGSVYKVISGSIIYFIRGNWIFCT